VIAEAKRSEAKRSEAKRSEAKRSEAKRSKGELEVVFFLRSWKQKCTVEEKTLITVTVH